MTALLPKLLKLTTYVHLWFCLIFFLIEVKYYILNKGILSYKQTFSLPASRLAGLWICCTTDADTMSWHHAKHLRQLKCSMKAAFELTVWLHGEPPWVQQVCVHVCVKWKVAAWGATQSPSLLHIPKLLTPGGLIVQQQTKVQVHTALGHRIPEHLHDIALKQVTHPRNGVQQHQSWLCREHLRFRSCIAIFFP